MLPEAIRSSLRRLFAPAMIPIGKVWHSGNPSYNAYARAVRLGCVLEWSAKSLVTGSNDLMSPRLVQHGP